MGQLDRFINDGSQGHRWWGQSRSSSQLSIISSHTVITSANLNNCKEALYIFCGNLQLRLHNFISKFIDIILISWSIFWGEEWIFTKFWVLFTPFFSSFGWSFNPNQAGHIGSQHNPNFTTFCCVAGGETGQTNVSCWKSGHTCWQLIFVLERQGEREESG